MLSAFIQWVIASANILLFKTGSVTFLYVMRCSMVERTGESELDLSYIHSSTNTSFLSATHTHTHAANHLPQAKTLRIPWYLTTNYRVIWVIWKCCQTLCSIWVHLIGWDSDTHTYSSKTYWFNVGQHLEFRILYQELISRFEITVSVLWWDNVLVRILDFIISRLLD